MNPLFAAALELQRFFEARKWRFCFIGGLAVQRWGEPRLTLDVDCTLLTGFGNEDRYVDELLAAFPGRVDQPRDFALAHRVLLLYASSRVPLNIALGAMPFEERCIGRASSFDIGNGQAILTCGAEDLIVFKAFAGRDRDWLDIATIILRQRDMLDIATIWNELLPLLTLKEDADTSHGCSDCSRQAARPFNGDADSFNAGDPLAPLSVCASRTGYVPGHRSVDLDASVRAAHHC